MRNNEGGREGEKNRIGKQPNQNETHEQWTLEQCEKNKNENGIKQRKKAIYDISTKKMTKYTYWNEMMSMCAVCRNRGNSFFSSYILRHIYIIHGPKHSNNAVNNQKSREKIHEYFRYGPFRYGQN